MLLHRSVAILRGRLGNQDVERFLAAGFGKITSSK